MSNEEESQTGHKGPGHAAAEGAEQGQSGQGMRRHAGVPARAGAGPGREAEERQAVEERLRFQSLVLDQINDAVVAVDGTQRVTYFNRAAERQYGVSAEEALGRPLREVYEYRWVKPADEAEAAEELARVGFWRGENIHVRRDGTALHVESAVSALRNEAGEPSGLLAIMRDVTSRGRAEKALRESEERLRLLVESVKDYAIFTIDTEGRVTSWNEGARRIKGYTAEEIIGRPVVIFYTAGDAAAGKPAAEMETALRIGRSEDESWRVRKGGSLFWGNEIMTPLRAEDGTLLGFTKVCRDLTERKRGEELIRASEERLRLVVESATDYAIFTLDTEGRIESWNVGAERVFGYAAEEVIGRHTEVLFALEDRGRGVAEEEMRRAGEQGRAEDDRWHTSKRGVRFFVSGVLAPLRDAGGALTGYVKIARDQTERQELEEALRRAHDELEERVRERTRELQEMAGTLLSEVKERAQAEDRVRTLLRQLVTVQEEERRRVARELHDTLGQQLTALSLSIDIIKSESEGSARLREHIGRTQSILDRLNSDVDFLAWELRPAALDQLGLDAALQTYVREWSEHFKMEAHYHGFGPDAPRLAPEVETNLYRILQEALQNVYKHSGASRVSVQLQQLDGRAVLVVEDDGRGYEPEEEASSGGNKRMGVINMKERAALVGGELEIESSPGEGTTVYVRVPLGRPGGKGEGA
jgi:PAS domain S-box-containing protein